MTSPCALHRYAYVGMCRSHYSFDAQILIAGFPVAPVVTDCRGKRKMRSHRPHNAFAINYPDIYSGNPRQKLTSVVLTRRRALR